jgi:hypothetical protein
VDERIRRGRVAAADRVSGSDGTEYEIRVIRRGVVRPYGIGLLLVTPPSLIVHEVLRALGRGYAVEVNRGRPKDGAPSKRTAVPYQLHAPFRSLDAALGRAKEVKGHLLA